MESKRPCKKCFLEELGNMDLYEQVKQAVEKLPKDAKVSDEDYEKRLNVCRNCDYLNEATCNACGCYAELRAAAVTGKCPYGKWER